MKFITAYQTAKTWQRKVILISLYHNAKLLKYKDWKLTDSARYFKISIGLISESLNLSKQFELVKECKSRNAALKKLKGN